MSESDVQKLANLQREAQKIGVDTCAAQSYPLKIQPLTFDIPESFAEIFDANYVRSLAKTPGKWKMLVEPIYLEDWSGQTFEIYKECPYEKSLKALEKEVERKKIEIEREANEKAFLEKREREIKELQRKEKLKELKKLAKELGKKVVDEEG